MFVAVQEIPFVMNTAQTIIVNLDASFGCNKLFEPSEGMFQALPST
jgi:hypothetical protein